LSAQIIFSKTKGKKEKSIITRVAVPDFETKANRDSQSTFETGFFLGWSSKFANTVPLPIAT
jgi:hypothetical protein